ncbi:MAG: N-acetylmuramoyl-L-alanine amidase, partial [Candidatus Latescibacteria bacterium]|nr:N-acetylmuramoyl-L-alanine amidase [Candidatus Latescibacterota bacterium]
GKRERDTVVRGVGQGNRSGQSPKRSQKGWGSAEEGIDTVVIDHSTQGNSRVERPARPTVVGRAQKETEWMIDTVVIDPGHGGQDAGAIGPTGLKEKDVALDIAKRLAKSLSKELGIKAVLTRTSDVFVGLKERSRVASKKAGGKLFISIHCNASRDPYAEGCEVYFLSEAKTDDAREVAMRENASFVVEMKGREKNRDLSALVGEILLGMESDQYLRESQDLAAMVVGEVVRQTPLASRGVKQAGFYVMKGTLATMPSILVETAFISNPKEERLLKDPDFREQFISSVTRAVGLFKQKYENGLARR